MVRRTSLVWPALAASALVFAVLVGCKENEPKTDLRLNDLEDLCAKASFQNLIGKDNTALTGVTLPQPNRILSPNSIMTMDYRADRMNIYLDRHGVIEKITCG